MSRKSCLARSERKHLMFQLRSRPNSFLTSATEVSLSDLRPHQPSFLSPQYYLILFVLQSLETRNSLIHILLAIFSCLLSTSDTEIFLICVNPLFSGKTSHLLENLTCFQVCLFTSPCTYNFGIYILPYK